MRGGHFLDPAEVNGIVHVVLPVDVRGLNGDNYFEGVRRRFGFQDNVACSTAERGEVTILP